MRDTGRGYSLVYAWKSDSRQICKARIDDQMIFLAAMGARATHLLTGDKTHFGRYYRRTIAGVLILPPSVYLRD